MADAMGEQRPSQGRGGKSLELDAGHGEQGRDEQRGAKSMARDPYTGRSTHREEARRAVDWS